jgi:hypothetical protein
MRRSLSPAEGRIKRVCVGMEGAGKWENTYAKQKYTPAFSRARGVTKYNSFFLIIIGFKGLSSITLC